MKRKMFVTLLTAACLSLLFCSTTFARSECESSDIAEIETVFINGEKCFWETFISAPAFNDSVNSLTSSIITRTKTSNLYNSAGEIMISVSVTGTFSYNGSSATCTSCSGISTSYNSAWEVYDYYTSRSVNTATNYTTAKQHTGSTTYTYHKNVTISCSADGTIS